MKSVAGIATVCVGNIRREIDKDSPIEYMCGVMWWTNLRGCKPAKTDECLMAVCIKSGPRGMEMMLPQLSEFVTLFRLFLLFQSCDLKLSLLEFILDGGPDGNVFRTLLRSDPEDHSRKGINLIIIN